MASTIKNTIAENFGGRAQNIATHPFSIDDVPDLTSKVAIVTGGSEGIGYGVSHTLLARNIGHIHLLSVSQEVVDGALSAIKSELGADAASRVTWYKCDLTDWSGVQLVADEIASKTSRLDILINNSGRGIMTAQLDIHEPYPLGGYAMSKGMAPFQKDQFEGAVSALYAATATEKTGEYICPPAVSEQGNNLSQDNELGEQLMSLTRSIVKKEMGEDLKDY